MFTVLILVYLVIADKKSYNKTKEMHYFLKFIFGIGLYMFRTGFLSIIRSLVPYTYMSYRLC